MAKSYYDIPEAFYVKHIATTSLPKYLKRIQECIMEKTFSGQTNCIVGFEDYRWVEYKDKIINILSNKGYKAKVKEVKAGNGYVDNFLIIDWSLKEIID